MINYRQIYIIFRYDRIRCKKKLIDVFQDFEFDMLLAFIY